MSGLLDLLLPTDCVGCLRPGRILCPKCQESLRGLGAVQRDLGPEMTVVAAGVYAGVLREAILAAKRGGSQPLVSALGELVADVLIGSRAGQPSRPLWLVPVHSGAQTRTRAGVDLVAVLASRGCRQAQKRGLQVRVADLLTRVRSTHVQKGLDRNQRQSNAAGAMKAHLSRLSPGRQYVIFDDVVTTGATMAEAHRALWAAGAEAVDAVVLASA
ncbi:MAG: ComF family protein [Candidatus Nanopelagicales bacterium]